VRVHDGDGDAAARGQAEMTDKDQFKFIAIDEAELILRMCVAILEIARPAGCDAAWAIDEIAERQPEFVADMRRAGRAACEYIMECANEAAR